MKNLLPKLKSYKDLETKKTLRKLAKSYKALVDFKGIPHSIPNSCIKAITNDI